MKIQLKKKLSEQVQISSEFETKKLTLDGEKLEEVLNYCLTKFTEGIIDPDISGRKPDGFIHNLQKGAFGDFSNRYIITAYKSSNSNNSNSNDEVIGILIGFPEEGQRLHIYSLHVSPDFRKSGVGSALLAKCVNDMCESNVKELVLDVHIDNTPANGLYKKFGFEIV